MNTDDKEIEGLLLRAQALHEVGRVKESLALLLRVAALWPESSDLYVDIAETYIDLGDYQRALVYTSKALRVKPDDGEAFHVRARAFFRQSKVDEAIDAARRAVRYRPDSPAPYATLSEALLSKGEHKEAGEIATRLRELFPGELLGHAMMGCVTGAQKKWAESEAHNRAALQIDPTYWLPLNNLGVALNNRGKREEALEVFLRLAQLRPDYPNNVQNLSCFSPSDLPVSKYDSLPPEVRKLIKSNARKRRFRFSPRRVWCLTAAIAPAPLYVLGTFLLPAATFSTLTLALVIWTGLVSAAAILRVPTLGIWKFNTVVALLGLGVWSLSYMTNVSGDAVNYNSVINFLALAVLLVVSVTKLAIYFRRSAQLVNFQREPHRYRTKTRIAPHSRRTPIQS